MPKKTKLQEKIYLKPTGSGKYSKYLLWLEWEGRILWYKKGIWRKINLVDTLRWDIIQEQPPHFGGLPLRLKDLRIILLKVQLSKGKVSRGKFIEGKTTEWRLGVPPKEFNTWLYWLLISIQKHANIPIMDEKMNRASLNPRHKGKIQTRRDMKEFDSLHTVFINAVERQRKGKELSPGRFDVFAGQKYKKTKIRGDSGITYKGFDKIGSGGGGDIFKTDKELSHIVRWEDGKKKIFHPAAVPVVVKKANLTDLMDEVTDKAEKLIREARILASMGEHPNIIRMFDAVASKGGIYLFMEKGEEDLTSFGEKGNLSIKQMLNIAMGILKGLSHMHQRRIYHLDMKGQNVLMFDDGKPKLIDFGITIARILDSKEEAKKKDRRLQGTAGYIPPETWDDDFMKSVDIREYFEKRDSYAAGMTILDAMIGPKYKFKYPGKKNLLSRITEEKKNIYWKGRIYKLRDILHEKKIKDLTDITLAMIDINFAKRLTVEQALKQMLKKWRRAQIKDSKEALGMFQHMQKQVGGDRDIMDSLTRNKKF